MRKEKASSTPRIQSKKMVKRTKQYTEIAPSAPIFTRQLLRENDVSDEYWNYCIDQRGCYAQENIQTISARGQPQLSALFLLSQ
ncbi:hypothetical protein SS50377_28025 [Spironucleus salmonicida]|uniref:Uncharacterized protein n=1 Tax=Spironucleus salmonicida TaxID=348837 RepID=V6LFV0_9EUKA|nr:hypothetical protein SS50377_28025 [Spironucleus salmonicida]|eukprot:EST42581.1 Hypothetical protein SS50377_17898 [Spironucleus salmonicida]